MREGLLAEETPIVEARRPITDQVAIVTNIVTVEEERSLKTMRTDQTTLVEEVTTRSWMDCLVNQLSKRNTTTTTTAKWKQRSPFPRKQGPKLTLLQSKRGAL
jgi:hypothetical protein